MSGQYRPSYGGPPDPIEFMRVSSQPGDVSSLLESNEFSPDVAAAVKKEESRDTQEQQNTNKETAKKQQEPQARGRPVDGIWPYRENLSFTRSLIFYGAGAVTDEHEIACKYINDARSLRQKYFGGSSTLTQKDLLSGPDVSFCFSDDGVVELFNTSDSSNVLVKVPTLEDFCADYNRLVEMVSDGCMRSFSFQRLQLLSSSFKTHVIANSSVEMEEQSNLLGTDFYRTMKIDNHIHLAAAATPKTFVDFVKNKFVNEGDTVVLASGKTLTEVFQEAGLDTEHFTIDAFSVMSDYSIYQRFDNFNSKYSPFRKAEMRQIFLKTSNAIEGRFFAELTKIVLARHEQSKGHASGTEMRLSIYGMNRDEWKNLSKWVLREWESDEFPGPVLSTHNRWLVQVPRLWRVFNRNPDTDPKAFQEMLENLFVPLFEATLRPEEHPEVAELLKHIVGFDSVDDEGNQEEICSCHKPKDWTSGKNPAYAWQLYFLWANLEVLNELRRARGLNTIEFRPHAGETGDAMHLAATYMLCRSINHGIKLEEQVSLQYLYYLDQVGLSVSPLSNNFLFRKIRENPFPKLFRRGLNVTLSTDDPLLFHMSDDALLEEYSVARASFDLSMTDISEIARNSVLQSGFEDKYKKEWLGEEYARGVTFCDETKTHVPLIRAKYRAEHLALEHMLVKLIANGKGKEVLGEMKDQFSTAREGHRRVLLDCFDNTLPSFPEQEQL